MVGNRQYDHEYKVQAVKLAKEIGQAKAAKELGVPRNTLYGRVHANRLGNLDLGAGSQTPQSAMTLNEELLRLRQQVKELEKEIPFYSLRHAVKPGVTGWAQVCYPYGSSVEDSRRKLEYDLYYAKNMSILLDVRIILKTIGVVLFPKGAR